MFDTRPYTYVLVVGLVLTTLSSPRPARAALTSVGTWSPSGYLITTQWDQTATLLSTGLVLVAGGESSNSTSLAEAELYDPRTGSWSVTGAMGVARASQTAVLLPSGDVLVAGGYSFPYTGTTVASAELYDPRSGTWTPTGSMTTARAGQTMTLLATGQVLVAGGYGPQDLIGPLASAELYDPQTGTWTPTGSMTTARVYDSATLLPDGRVLVAGGGNATTTLASAELYDPSTGTWTATAPMNLARANHTATLLPDGQVLVAGGCEMSCPRAELYTPSTGTWAATGSMTAAREGQTATLLVTGDVLVAGGTIPCEPTYCGFALASAELYDPATGTWTATGAMSEPRSGHTATLLPDGTVLAVSDISTDRYTPGAPALVGIQPSTTHVGQTLALTGSRFAADESVTLALDGTPLTTTLGSSTGSFATTLTVPASLYGAHTLGALGLASGLVATATLQVRAAVALSAYSGTAGSTDTAVGTGFGAREPVVLFWDTPSGPVLGATLSSSTGSFSGTTKITFRVPPGAQGWHALLCRGVHSGAVASTILYEQ